MILASTAAPSRRLALFLGSALLSGACAERAVEPSDRVRIAIAPLTLPGVADACYDLAVTSVGETVWTKGTPHLSREAGDADAVCASRYGAAGGVSYVGACDATSDADGDPSNGVQNTVTLWVDGLYDDAGHDVGQWRDPCPSAGCALQVDCRANADSQATFDLTIMRAANQGFFDVAVNFSDVFCSAKLDSCSGQGDDEAPMKLLFGPDGSRAWTAVFGLSCSGGPGAATTLRYGDVGIACAGPGGTIAFAVDPAVMPGNASVLDVSGAHVLHYGVYRDDAALTCDGAACAQRDWNLAFDVDDLALASAAVAGPCTLTLTATASDGAAGFSHGLPTAGDLAYPYIDVSADLATAGAGVCLQHGLDDGGPVASVYHGDLAGLPAPVPVCQRYDGAVADDCAAPTVACPCWSSLDDIVAKAAAIKAQGSPDYFAALRVYPDGDLSETDGDIAAGPQYLSVFAGDDSDAPYCFINRDDDADSLYLADISRPALDACLADIVALMDDRCQMPDHGSCSGATPGCVYDAPSESHCVQCVGDNQCAAVPGLPVCDLYVPVDHPDDRPGYSCIECGGNPDYQTVGPGWECPSGDWCDPNVHACAAPGAWVDLGFQQWSDGIAACALLGMHVPSVSELQSAMTAQFLGGIVFAGVSFNDQDYYATSHATDAQSNLVIQWYGDYAEVLNGPHDSGRIVCTGP